MPRTKNCDSCSSKHNCSDIYNSVGKTKGPAIGFHVFIAFFVPIVVFIAGLVVFEKVLTETAIADKFKTAIAFLLSLIVTAAVMLIIKLIKLNFKK